MRNFSFFIFGILFLLSFNFSYADEYKCNPTDANNPVDYEIWQLDYNKKTFDLTKAVLKDGMEFSGSQLSGDPYFIFEENPTQIKFFTDDSELGRLELFLNLDTLELKNQLRGSWKCENITMKEKKLLANKKPITFLGVNQGMSNDEKSDFLSSQGYNCAELAGNFACAKGDSKIQILSERVQFNCNSYNGCAYKESDVISSLEKNFGIDISSTEIISSYSGDYRATCGDGSDGDRICVVENNGTDVWLFKGSLGASGMSF